MELEWDDRKAAQNLEKHGVSFEDARSFDFDTAVTIEDTRYAYPEPRWIAFGVIRDRPHILIYTWREQRVRVISLRRANPREVRRYGRT